MRNFILGITMTLYFILCVFDTYKDEVLDDYYLDLLYTEYNIHYVILNHIVIISTIFQLLILLWDKIENKIKNN